LAVSVVQSAQATATDSGGNPAVTVTLGTATTAGNCLVVVADTGNATTNAKVSAVTLGGSAGNFGSLYENGTVTSTVVADFWADPSCAGGQTSVAVSTSGGSGTGYCNVSVLEVSGLAAALAGLLDQDAGSAASGTNWTSTATGATSQAGELWVGTVGCYSHNTITGPSSPWVNLAQQDNTAQVSSMTGYQAVSSTGTAVYAGTLGSSGNYLAAVVTLKAAGVVPAGALLVPRLVAAGAV
jgi:hypothetical protein